MTRILITRKLMKSSEDYALKIFDVKLNKEDKLLTKDELISKSSDCDGILSSITEKLDAGVISKLSDKVKIISNFAVGFGNIDIDAAKKRNIVVTNTPDVLTDANTEMKIHYYNRSRLDKNLEKDAIYHKSLESLISVSDFFSINCPATKETKHIINNKTIKYFPDGAVIANSARGDMIDDDAMVKALKSGKIFSLGLDVYNGEPNIYPEYLTLSNVFVLPHLGSATTKTRIAMGNLAVSNIEEFFKTGKCNNFSRKNSSWYIQRISEKYAGS